jgi:hypothetical protein
MLVFFIPPVVSLFVIFLNLIPTAVLKSWLGFYWHKTVVVMLRTFRQIRERHFNGLYSDAQKLITT